MKTGTHTFEFLARPLHHYFRNRQHSLLKKRKWNDRKWKFLLKNICLYRNCGHRLIKVRVGNLISHDMYSIAPIPWKGKDYWTTIFKWWCGRWFTNFWYPFFMHFDFFWKIINFGLFQLFGSFLVKKFSNLTLLDPCAKLLLRKVAISWTD